MYTESQHFRESLMQLVKDVKPDHIKEYDEEFDEYTEEYLDWFEAAYNKAEDLFIELEGGKL